MNSAENARIEECKSEINANLMNRPLVMSLRREMVDIVTDSSDRVMIAEARLGCPFAIGFLKGFYQPQKKDSFWKKILRMN